MVKQWMHSDLLLVLDSDEDSQLTYGRVALMPVKVVKQSSQH